MFQNEEKKIVEGMSLIQLYGVKTITQGEGYVLYRNSDVLSMYFIRNKLKTFIPMLDLYMWYQEDVEFIL